MEGVRLRLELLDGIRGEDVAVGTRSNLLGRCRRVPREEYPPACPAFAKSDELSDAVITSATKASFASIKTVETFISLCADAQCGEYMYQGG